MKICFFTENYYKGGLDTFLISLINAWPDLDDKLTLVCNGSHSGLKTIAGKINRPIKVSRYYRIFTSSIAQGFSRFSWGRSLPIKFFFSLARRLIQYPILFPWYVFTLILFFWRSDYDRLIVVNGGYPASLLCRSAVIAWGLSKTPYAILNIHSTATTSTRWFHFFEDSIDKWVVKLSRNIICVSNESLKLLRNRREFLNCSKLSYIHNGIEDPIRSVDQAFEKVPVRSSGTCCLMLATYHPYKGHFYLLEAFKHVLKDFPDTRLEIFGDGLPIEKKRVADEIVRLGLENNVLLGDFTTQTAALFSKAGVLVVPSQAYESFGLTIIEAMAFGVPIVTTDVGGMPEVLENSNAGYVCPRDRPEDFANAIKSILSNPGLSSEMGRNGRKTFEGRFTAKKMAIQYRKMLK